MIAQARFENWFGAALKNKSSTMLARRKTRAVALSFFVVCLTIALHTSRKVIASAYSGDIRLKVGVHFLSFASSDHDMSELRREAEKMNFESSQIWDESVLLQSDFWLEHQEFIKSHKRGYGYWIWKPYIILERLKQLPHKAVLLYADGGCELNPASKKLDSYAKMALQSRGLLLFHTNYDEAQYCKRDTIAKILPGAPLDILRKQRIGTFFLAVNIEKVRQFFEEVLEIATVDNYHFVDDSASATPELPEFIEHRHDQSIISLLSKHQKYGFHSTPDQSYPPSDALGTGEPIIATRRRNPRDEPLAINYTPITINKKATYVDHVALGSLRKISEQIHSKHTPSCQVVSFGETDFGRHEICDRTYPSDCVSLTYGVQTEYTFELDVNRRLGCTVFALDPTVNHKAELAPGVYFLKWGAPSNSTARHIGSSQDWFLMSPARLSSLVARHKKISILKMDCEGCEYFLYDDVIREQPDFFTTVDQFAIEIHFSISLGLSSLDRLYSLGQLFNLLERSCMKLEHWSITHCAPEEESSGLLDEFQQLRFLGANEGHCHNYLFAHSENCF